MPRTRFLYQGLRQPGSPSTPTGPTTIPIILTVLIILAVLSPTYRQNNPGNAAITIGMTLILTALIWAITGVIATFLPRQTVERDETQLTVVGITLERAGNRPVYQVTAKTFENGPLEVFEIPRETPVFEDAAGNEGQMTRIIEKKQLAAPFDVLIYLTFLPNGETETVSFSEVHVPQGMLAQSQ